MAFTQTPPQLGNQYADDRVLRSYLARALPPDVLKTVEPELSAVGALAGGELYRLQLADRLNEPRLTQYDAWGNRIDHVELTPLWRQAEALAARHGLVAVAHEKTCGEFSRVVQFALAYLFTPSTDIYSCPLAMTDGAAAALLASGNTALIERALPHLTSRDPQQFWTSGQWMTETSGGSDVGNTETVARNEDGQWRLYGRKWFTSAINSQMALTLARPDGNPAGARGLALFYVEMRDADSRPNGIRIDRLKDKLGTRKVPTAELTLDGAIARPVHGLTDGIRSIAPMLNVTRTWNSVAAIALMRRGIALARDFAARRSAFGASLADKPLHLDTLAALQAEFEAAFHLTFFVAELLGRYDAGRASAEQQSLLRLLTPIAKLTTARQCVAVLTEIIEAFGGAGYIEDTGIPLLLRDAHVLPIWEGTTNVLALDVLQVAASDSHFDAWRREIGFLLQGVRDPALIALSAVAERIADQAAQWLTQNPEQATLEAGARRFALTLGRVSELVLLLRQAQWSLDHEKNRTALAAARRFAAHGVARIMPVDAQESRLLARDG
ncbi:MAG TPA: acyl-CoA dehydrogenase family protein [Burkholderiales bacterium]|nr:acyl-CoA dehydrogenase family protein [Burkholderiales bacterium]